jgi:hypothetical protein
MLARRCVAVAATLWCLSLPACYTSIGKWTYPSGRYDTRAGERPAPAFVLVEPLLDLRGTTNLSYMIWYYIPLSPMGWSVFDRPEATVHGADTTQYVTDPCSDLARAIVIELQRERLVERAAFAADYRPEAGATHVLRGRLRSYFVEETRVSYGLSIYANILWSLGLPMGLSKNGFCADLELFDLAQRRVVWTATIFDADSHIEGFYYGPEWYRFSWMWERRLREKLGGLAAALGGEPAPLPDKLREELKEAPEMPGNVANRSGSR